MKKRFFIVTFIALCLSMVAMFISANIVGEINKNRENSITASNAEEMWMTISYQQLTNITKYLDSASLLKSTRSLLNATDKTSVESLKKQVKSQFEDIKKKEKIETITIINNQGLVSYSFPDHIVRGAVPKIVELSLNTSKPVRGLGLDWDGEVSLQVAKPILSDGKLIGIILITKKLDESMLNFLGTDYTKAYLLNPKGEVVKRKSLLSGIDVLANEFQLPQKGEFSKFYELQRGDQIIGISIITLLDFNQKLVGYLAFPKDVTAMTVFKLSQYGLAAVPTIAMVLIILLLVYRTIVWESNKQDKLKTEQIVQLNKVNVDLQRANSAKSQFLGNMSHELRTPINGILGATDLLSMGELGDDESEYLSLIKASVGDMTKIIENILDFTQIQSGKFELKVRQFNLEEEIHNSLINIADTAKRKGLDFSVMFGETVPKHVSGDSERICQVLRKLADNAVKFTEKGSVNISVKVNSINNKTAELEFAIKDTGIGIPPERQMEIFESFSQADNSDTRQHGGLGLGLSICSNLVPKLGGRLWLKSKLNQGSEFYFSTKLTIVEDYKPTTKLVSYDQNTSELIPQMDKEEKLVNKNINLTTQPVPKSIEGNNKSGLNVLVVEDIAINQRVVTHILKSLGHAVDLASNGEEAVEKYNTHNYDLIFMDIHMPVMDGMEATARIRELEAKGHDKSIIIALTARVLTQDRNTCIEGGMDDFISKPVSREIIEEKIGSYFDLSESGKEAGVSDTDSNNPSTTFVQ